MKMLPTVTLIGADCLNLERLQLAADICQQNFSFGAVKLLSSIPSSDPRVVPIAPIRSTAEYSWFCVTQMAQYVDTECALIIQHDGFILNPEAWSDEFLRYDYIGAPWYHLGSVRVGNGGFTLRSKRLLDYIAAQYRAIGGILDPEDYWICSTARPALEAAGMRFAPEEVAARFSKEGNHRSVVWDGQFGFHGLSYTDISAWLTQHPEYAGRLRNTLDDYSTLMRERHPVWDGSVHTLRYHRMHMKAYQALKTGLRDYDASLDEDFDEEPMQAGHTAIFKRVGVPLVQVPIPAFERTIVGVEHFSNKRALLEAHPDVEITYRAHMHMPKWEQRLAALLGNAACPNNKPYTFLRFA